MEYPHECSEQMFSRYYANSIATHIANSNPKIKQVFESWKKYTSNALLSNLEKNQELKNILIEETPFVNEAKNESERKRRVGVLFDLNRMSGELKKTFDKLSSMQLSSGAFPWFEGMKEDRFITQHIVCGMGHLEHLGIINHKKEKDLNDLISKAVGFLDYNIYLDYQYLLKLEKEGNIKLSDNNIGSFQIHYLYTRSYFRDIEVKSKFKDAFNYFEGQLKTYWQSDNRYLEGMTALALYRLGDTQIPFNIIKSLRENAIENEEMGMYWKDIGNNYYWYQAPIETQSLLIELFNDVAKDTKAIDDMKVWLLKQKQTQDWKTTKATVDACYALLLTGSDWLSDDMLVDITIGNIQIDPFKAEDTKLEAGSGYFKTSWKENDIIPSMGNVTVTKKNAGVSWGALYWQYFENLDKITNAETKLKLEKKLFIQTTTGEGFVLTPIYDTTNLQIGDIVKVRIELRSDRDLEYVHMKDLRASCFEPMNVLSQYKYQDRLGYYESTRDASTNFFFEWIPKGIYVFEYSLRVSHSGDFSNGITSIQCMYAPEFSSHSEGIRIKVNK